MSKKRVRSSKEIVKAFEFEEKEANQAWSKGIKDLSMW